jgi:hypothetical protein
MPLQGKQLQGTGEGSSSASDVSSWKLLTVSDITATSDPNTLETSKAMSGNEFQFRGSAPSGSNLANPDDGCLYSFALIDPDTGVTLDPKSGDLVGVEFYFQLGSSIPDAQNEQCSVGVWNSSNGNFGGLKHSASALQLVAGTYTLFSPATVTHSSGMAYLIRIGAMDQDASSNGLTGPVDSVAFDDPGTPARAKAKVSASSQSLSGTFSLALVCAGNLDVTCYYRVIRVPSSPF